MLSVQKQVMANYSNEKKIKLKKVKIHRILGRARLDSSTDPEL